MGKKRTYRKTNKKIKAREPKQGYSLKIYSSFEEANEADDTTMAALTPLECLANATALIKRVFSKELKEKNDLTVHFD